MRHLADQSRLDAACFRLWRLGELMGETDGIDYRGRPLEQVAALTSEMKCSVGRDRFREGVRRHGLWLRSLSYEQYLQSSDWAVVRYFALRRARYVCEGDGCSGSRGLQVHHLSYDRRCVEVLADVVVLCGRCHERTHGLPAAREVARRWGLRPISDVLVSDAVVDKIAACAPNTIGTGEESV